MLVSMMLGACAPDAHEVAANQDKTRLDQELHHARYSLGIPDYMLHPIEMQEQKVASGAGGFNYSYQDADGNYKLLYTQLIGIEQTADQTLRKQVQADVEAFTTALNERRAQGFSQATIYQARLDQALKDFDGARTAGDYARIDTSVQQQTAALRSLWPAYQKLQDFRATLRAMHNAGVNSSLGEAEYAQDVQAFDDASSVDRYQKLVSVIDGQIMQLMADETEALPYIGSTMLSTFQARIDLLHRYGESIAVFQKQHNQDQQELSAARSLADYLTLAQIINKQTSAMELPLIRGKAHYDLDTLKHLVSYANTKKMTDPYNGSKYPIAYEYADADNGIGIVEAAFNQATNASGFQGADDDINVLITNLRALLDNMPDTTAHSLPHQADLQLMQTYGIMSGKVIIISLREQTTRFYNNGKMVYWAYVTTGRIERTTPPGLHYAMEKLYHTQFVSGDPKTSPLWYGPTAINYAILYANYGFFLHDAWWRYMFGPNSEFPHWDPLAFNGGSHGCVNFAEDTMAWVYNWTAVGTPVVIY